MDIDRLNQFMHLHTPPKQAVEQPTQAAPTTTSRPESPGFQPDVVNISPEGRSQSISENKGKPLWQGLHSLALNKPDKPKPVETAAQAASKSPIDVAIKDIQEQIRKLQERMEALEGKNDEASQKQLEQLEIQMMALNTQLMELNNKKLEQMKVSKT